MKFLRDFIKVETASGIVLFAATLLALMLANSPLLDLYNRLFHDPIIVNFNSWKLAVTLTHIINDGLMTIFFLIVSLEIKREFLIGELNTRAKALLPGIAAAGGMLMPALIFLACNFADKTYISGWAIPTATDIAFSLGILSLLGDRIPASLKAFLMALAIIDDLGAIIIIAVFYTNHIAIAYLLLACLAMIILYVLNRCNITQFWPYLITGILLWLSITQAGIHATIAGVILGFAIPLNVSRKKASSPLQKLEKILHPWVAYGILPLFALANAGLSLSGVNQSLLINPLTLGCLLGLLLGKPLGVLGASFIAIKTKIARLPAQVSWTQFGGAACLCGIGFTMSLFIGTLAFSEAINDSMLLIRLGVFTGSCLAGITGYFILRRLS